MASRCVYSAISEIANYEDNMNEIPKVSYTMDQAAQATGFTRTRLYQEIAQGRLKTLKAGRRRMVSARALEDFISRLERASGGRVPA